MEINIQELLKKHFSQSYLTIPDDYMPYINSAIKEIITEVLKEAADSAYGETHFTIDGEREVLIDKESITSTINKVKF